MKKLIQIIFLFALIQESILPQWYQQTSGTTKGLIALSFVDENNGWIVGDSGAILHTSNSGIDWITQNSGTKRTLSDISFSDLNHGTAVGDSGMILRTNDGGLNWFQQTSGTNAFLHSISFVSANIGWSVGCVYNPSNYYGIILHTENAGETWEQQFVVDNQFLYGVSFVDTNIGWAVGGYPDNVILKTTNGGKIWIQQTSGTTLPLKDVSFVNMNNGWVVGFIHDIFGFILKTNDGGLTWAQQLISATLFFSVRFIDENNGTVVGWDDCYTDLSILRTTDGGTNWNPQSSGTLAPLYDVFFADAVNGWVVGAGGAILHTTNGGVTFIEEAQIDETPTEFSLSHNYPNPFNPSTVISFQLPEKSNVELKIYDIIGNEITTLVNEEKLAGTHQVTWDASNLPSGIYVYQLRTENYTQMEKMILLK